MNAGLTPGIDVHPSREQACRALAREIAELVRAQPAAVLGFPTGDSPVPLYRELVRLHREEGLSFTDASDRLRPTEAPRTHADPAHVIHRIADARQLPVEH